jgi:tetratricopeptide (TPR) repeat protein
MWQSLHTHLQKARLLLEQNRFEDASNELKNALALDPANSETLGLMARLQLDTNHPSEALELLDHALSLDPEEDYYLYLRSFAFYRLEDLRSAAQSIGQALAMNPFHAGYFALYSFILIRQRKFEEALEKADEGLRIDAADIGCLNARSQALNKLNRTQDAIDTMQNTLGVDPENDFSHTTIGFNYLEKGKHELAANHFREALRINPGNVSAREGMKEALKSKIAPYRWLLQYEYWIQSKGKNTALISIIGLFILYRLALYAATHFPKPWNYLMWIPVALYLVFVIISWLIIPLANFFLLYHPEGRYALTDREKKVSQMVVGLLGAAFLIFLTSLFLGDNPTLKEKMEMGALVVATLCLPAQKLHFPLFLQQHPWSHRLNLGLFGVAFLAFTVLIFHLPLGSLLVTGYLLLWLASTWFTAFSGSK